MLIVMGDLYAKVGKVQKKSLFVGAQSLGEQNEWGVLLTDFCASNDFIISNTYLEHHPCRLYTWTGPEDRVRNQIDYITYYEC